LKYKVLIIGKEYYKKFTSYLQSFLGFHLLRSSKHRHVVLHPKNIMYKLLSEKLSCYISVSGTCNVKDSVIELVQNLIKVLKMCKTVILKITFLIGNICC